MNTKPAKRISEIPNDWLNALNRGEVESRNLVEWLAVDQLALLEAVVGSAKYPELKVAICRDAAKLKKPGVNALMRCIGATLAEHVSVDQAVWNTLITHASDSVRCWMCYALMALPDGHLADRLHRILPLVKDPHFGVREVAWMAFRPFIIDSPEAAVRELLPLTQSADANVRRFTSEATRPRGVWCAHIVRFKEHPEGAQPLLESLKYDDSRYVQDSVANWLNDASKTRPDFVLELTNRWRDDGVNPYVLRRACRSI